MAAGKSPFIQLKITCPVCETVGMQHKIRAGSYTVVEKEEDQHPKLYKWSDPGYESVNPAHYALWRCPKCMYVDFVESFERAMSDPRFHVIKKIYRATEDRDKTFLFQISEFMFGVDPMALSFETALNMHLAAIFIQELPARAGERNFYKLARLYLRTAWLYRERYGASPAAVLPGSLKNIMTALGELDEKMAVVDEAGAKLVSLLKARVDELYSNSPVQVNDPYVAASSSFTASVKSVLAELNRIRANCALDRSGFVSATGGIADGYFNHRSHMDFLLHLSNMWQGLPLSEKTALSAAARNYALSYSGEDFFDTVEKRMQVMDLIIELHIRVDDYQAALRCVGEVMRNVDRDRQKHYKRLSLAESGQAPLSQIEKDRIDGFLAKINASMAGIVERKKRIEERWLEFCMPALLAALDGAAGLSGPVIEEKVAEAGIPENVYRLYKEKLRMNK